MRDEIRWAHKVLEPPSAEPVTLAEAKEHLRVTDDAEDAYISSLIRQARELCEEIQGRAYLQQRQQFMLERWPVGRRILLPRPPLASVDAIRYVNAYGQTVTVDPAMYRMDAATEPGAVVLAPGQSWPSEALDVGLPITIEYTAGYDDPARIPANAIHAIKLLIAHAYEHREPVIVGSTTRAIEFSVGQLLSVHRVFYPGPEV